MENNLKADFVAKFRERTKRFVVDVIELYRSLPKTEEARIIGKQLLRSASSVGANYRAACGARSQAEFHSKTSIVIEEADESIYLDGNIVRCKHCLQISNGKISG